jgi:hypothetical protein
LNDNLLERSSPAEVKAVMGHELGHYVLNHLPFTVLVLTLVLGLGLFLLWWLTPRILARHGARWGVRDTADPAVVPLFALIFALYMFAMTPVNKWLIRSNETAADAFGLDAAREPDGFASIAMKLSEYRKIEPGPIEETIFFDHLPARPACAWRWSGRPAISPRLGVSQHLPRRAADGHRMSIRRRLYFQLEPLAWPGQGVSPLNRLLVAAILLATAGSILQTEPLIAAGREPWFRLAELGFGALFLAEYAGRLWTSAENPAFGRACGVGSATR